MVFSSCIVSFQRRDRKLSPGVQKTPIWSRGNKLPSLQDQQNNEQYSNLPTGNIYKQKIWHSLKHICECWPGDRVMGDSVFICVRMYVWGSKYAHACIHVGRIGGGQSTCRYCFQLHLLPLLLQSSAWSNKKMPRLFVLAIPCLHSFHSWRKETILFSLMKNGWSNSWGFLPSVNCWLVAIIISLDITWNAGSTIHLNSNREQAEVITYSSHFFFSFKHSFREDTVVLRYKCLHLRAPN